VQQNADELKQRVLAQAQSLSPDDYAFTRTIHSMMPMGLYEVTPGFWLLIKGVKARPAQLA
jgi:hypothetical protein